MRNNIDSITRLQLTRYIADMQLEHISEFNDAQQAILRRNIKKIEDMICSECVSTDTINKLIQGLHPAFQYYSNTFSVFYKISRRAVEDYSGEGLFFPYKKHQLNVDESFYDRNAYENKEVIPTNWQEIDDMRWTGLGTHGLCFIQNEGEILRFLDYGTQLTISILDPLIFPLYKTLVRTQTLFNMQYQISQAYISENIQLDDYRIFKQLLYRANNLDYFFMPSSYEQTIFNFVSSIAKYPGTEDVISFMRSIKRIYLQANRKREKFFCILDSEFPGESHEYLFHDEEMINRERRWIGITETVEETQKRILHTYSCSGNNIPVN